MLRNRSYKFRLYPTKKQIELILKTIGCCRFVANFALAQQKKVEDLWQTTNELVQSGMLSENLYKSSFFNTNESVKDVAKLKKHYLWLKEVDSIALQSAVKNVGEAYSRYYKKVAKKPNFKSKKIQFSRTQRSKRTGTLPSWINILNSQN